MRLLLLIVVVLLSSCVHTATRGLTSQEQQAVAAAEAFVIRHGYTATGHPSDKPVHRVSIFDVLRSHDELVKTRKGLLEPLAIAVERKGRKDFWVYFPESASPDNPRIVYVHDGEARQLFHQSYGPPGEKAVHIESRGAPPNNSFKGMPLRGTP